MSSIIQILVAAIIVCILLLYGHYQNQENRKSWLHSINALHDLVSETEIIKWETPVFYSSENYFKSIWKGTAFEGCGLLCQLETRVVFVGFLRNSPHLESTLSNFAPDRTSVSHYDPKCTFIEYTCDPEHTDVAWIGRFWVNGGWSWFALSTQEQRHYFTVYHGKRTIFGSKAASKKIYDRLTEFLKSP
jgi:hypothetical protein